MGTEDFEAGPATPDREGLGSEGLPVYGARVVDDADDFLSLVRTNGSPVRVSLIQTNAVLAVALLGTVTWGLATGGRPDLLPWGLLAALAALVVLAPLALLITRLRWRSAHSFDVLAFDPFRAAEAMSGRAGVLVVRIRVAVTWAVLAFCGVMFVVFFASAFGERSDAMVVIGTFVLGIVVGVGFLEVVLTSRWDRAHGVCSYIARPFDGSAGRRRRRVRVLVGHDITEGDPGIRVLPSVPLDGAQPTTSAGLPIGVRQAMLYVAGRFDEATTLGAHAYETHPSAGTAFRNAEAEERAGRTSEALAWLARAASDGWSDPARLNMKFPRLRKLPEFAAIRAQIAASAARAI